MPFRLLLAVGASIGVALLLVLVLYLTDLGLFGVGAPTARADHILDAVSGAPGRTERRRRLSGLASAPAGQPAGKSRAKAPAKPPDEKTLLEEVTRREADGVQVDAIRRELEELQRRRAVGEIIVAVFGEISAGKSSLIRALLPGTAIAVDVRGGTTREVTYFTWTSSAGDKLILADLPGLNEADGSLDQMARDEALRAHVVIYVCEGDLTRDQYQALVHWLSWTHRCSWPSTRLTAIPNRNWNRYARAWLNASAKSWRWCRCSVAVRKK